jgi:ribosomal protein L25 (general stress protein Ctc)
MTIQNIKALTRNWVGGAEANRSRLQNRIPAVLVHQGKAQHLELTDAKAFLYQLTHNLDNHFLLDIDAQESVTVILKEVQRHPISLKVLHVDFYLTPEHHA